jgi:hypothetical protein
MRSNRRFDVRRFWRDKQEAALGYAVEFMPPPEAANHRAVKVGRAMMNAGAALAFVAPLLSALVMVALSPVAAVAQSTGTVPTGQFFGQDENSFGNIINAAFLAFAALLLIGGAAAIGWGITCIWTGQSYVKQFVGGVLSFGFGAVVAAAWAISRGRTPPMPASLGQ